ncbi:sulfotransferase family 2 domain-containing protein [Thalassomonas sp. RHCl1]|uniref:sulfotransferase family 2 domain-containing protein n=1 Tax=Thalassomonas sp. RHCl1 TaxID=2995320 RepID=UPI00248B5F99|nr:sulfotransferase family 2 domain-containing protein [Thalassomonas sp. RHCl1]
MISHQDKCVFVHLPKAAGQSIESVFVARHGLDWQQRQALLLKPNSDPAQGPPRLAHLTAQEYLDYGYLTPGQFQQYFKFAFVRNPWSRLVSEYHYRRLHGDHAYQLDFKAFLFGHFPTPDCDDHVLGKDYYRHVLPQWRFLYDEQEQCLVDFIGKFETLQQDFSRVCQLLNIPPQTLPHKNKTLASGVKQRIKQKMKSIFPWMEKKRHYTCFFDEESRDFVGELYKKDIELFQYRFGAE